jgi:hypothetical protein
LDATAADTRDPLLASCATATVQSDVLTVNNDVGSIQSDQGSSQSDVSSVSSDVTQLNQDEQTVQNDEASDSQATMPAGIPSTHDVQNALQTLQAAIIQAKKASNQAIAQANALEATAASYQRQSDSACNSAQAS